MNGKQKFYILLFLFQIFLIGAVFFSVNGIIILVAAQSSSTDSFQYYNSPTAAMLAISAGISVSAAVLGSAMAIKTVGTAASRSFIRSRPSASGGGWSGPARTARWTPGASMVAAAWSPGAADAC